MTQPSELEQRFKSLVERWKANTLHESSSTLQIEDSNYQDIMALGTGGKCPSAD